MQISKRSIAAGKFCRQKAWRSAFLSHGLSSAVALTIGLFIVQPSYAKAGDPIVLQVTVPYWHTTSIVDAQGRAETTTEWARKVLTIQGRDASKTVQISYSESAQLGEVLEAYTLKSDGKRIEVPKDNYQYKSNRGQQGGAPAFSDTNTITVTFPVLEVGDTEVVKTRIRDKEPLFAGQFSARGIFPPILAVDDMTYRLVYPADWKPLLGESVVTRTEGSTGTAQRFVEWRYSNPHPVEPPRRNDWSVINEDAMPFYAFSTFREYADIARAYGARALPKAVVTPAVRSLADQIAPAPAPADAGTARKLYDWVASNIGYAGNCIGVGSVVPRNMDFVLTNRLGDCKDHAALLQALLSAKGIEATQALVNAGPGYQLPKIPGVSAINHVINYLPKLDLFLDSTAASTPYGRMPIADQGKTALLVDGREMRVPIDTAKANVYEDTLSITFDADGNLTGYEDTALHGLRAYEARDWARKITDNDRTGLVKAALAAKNLDGDGTLALDDPTEVTDRYHMRTDFKVQHVLVPSGAYYLDAPIGHSAVPQSLKFAAPLDEVSHDYACLSEGVTDHFTVNFPAETRVLSVPHDVSLSNELVTYKATYKLKGTTLVATREKIDRFPDIVCSAAQAAEYKKIGDAIVDDLRSPVMYQLPTKQ